MTGVQIPDRALPVGRRFLINPNLFGITLSHESDEGAGMAGPDPEMVVRESLDVPADAPTETLDVRTLGPPGPLKETLEMLADTDEETLLVQINDRAPRHLYPKLDDRGYEYGTVELEEMVVTGIWTR